MTKFKLIQELQSGDVIQIADGSTRKVKSIVSFSGQIYGITCLDVETNKEVYVFEYVNSKLYVQEIA